MSTTPQAEQNGPVHILGKSKPSQAKTGVPLFARNGTPADYRTYEIYQRERVHESTEKIRPIQLVSPDFVRDPYPVLETLRENYPCYRDWMGNAYWITRYDDVTSVFTDDANFETRPKLWVYRRMGWGRDLRHELPVLFAHETGFDRHVEQVTSDIIAGLKARAGGNLVLDFAARLPMDLWVKTLNLPEETRDSFVKLYWQMQRGWDWNPEDEQRGLAAMEALAALFDPLIDARRVDPGEDMISVIAALDLADSPATGRDVVVTLLEWDHESLHGALANLWLLLLTHPDELDHVRDERRMVKFAYLETLRHSTPVLWKRRYARHEVERFGRLLPIGGLFYCAAAAANRDPRQYMNPDQFIVSRKDLCQREPRGQYRADGLPAGVTLGMGPPSKHPAIPEDRPRSLYAITRDTAVTASTMLLDAFPDLRLEDGATPTLRCLRLNEMHTCWHLPVRMG